MLAHIGPQAAANSSCGGLGGPAAAAEAPIGASADLLLQPAPAVRPSKGRNGSICLTLHAAPRREGPDIDPGAVSGGARAGRLRGALLLSGARPAGPRCRGQCAAGRDRSLDWTLSPLFRGARAVLGRALRPERNPQARRRGEGDLVRTAQNACRDRGYGRVRRPWPQVSDLGAEPLRRGTRGGHREGSHLEAAARFPGGGGPSARSAGMMASRDSKGAVAGGPARHIPVLARRAVEFLAVRKGGIYIDATFGGGGYSREILAAAECSVIGIDRDPNALARGTDLVAVAGGRLVLIEDRFSNLAAVARNCGYGAVDGIALDLGVSSMQLDESGRGFSFRADGPLDMRMGSRGPTAADVVAHASERDVARIIATLGEERHARAIARAIVRAREKAPLVSTRSLAEIVEGVVRPRAGAIHPATRTFQALRIFVNEELHELAAALRAAENMLRPGGRLVVVTFHSLEDRIVKTFLAERGSRPAPSRHLPALIGPPATFRVLTNRPVTPDDSEIDANPRARSAKLRAADRS